MGRRSESPELRHTRRDRKDRGDDRDVSMRGDSRDKKRYREDRDRRRDDDDHRRERRGRSEERGRDGARGRSRERPQSRRQSRSSISPSPQYKRQRRHSSSTSASPSSSSSSPSCSRRRRSSSKKKKSKKSKRSKHSHLHKNGNEYGTEDGSVKQLSKKKRKKRDKELEIFGYSNETNPFGDTNLGDKFVWKKKVDKQLSQGMSRRELGGKAEKKRRRELMEELQKAKERREEREREKELWEEEQRRMDRLREADRYADWERQEVEFHLEQAKRRAKIRIQEGRPKPIDVLYKNLSLDMEFDFDTREPTSIFDGLELKELRDLRQDIDVYLDLDDNEQHREFWEAMTVVCDDRITSAEKAVGMERLGRAQQDVTMGSEGVHSSVIDDIARAFYGKGSTELDELRTDVVATLRSGQSVDVEYWETLLARLKVARAVARLKEIHRELLQERLKILRQKATEELQTAEAEAQQSEKERKEREERKKKREEELRRHEEQLRMEEGGSHEAEVETPVDSLKQMTEDDKEALEGMDESDVELILAQRREVLEKRAKMLQERAAAIGNDEDVRSFEQRFGNSEESLNEDEEAFTGGEVDLSNKSYSWLDKYRPRRPKYFNRIKTGYEWNKYNQMHYDHDTPPPKIVQGYKFNIFYPDLIDKTKTPMYKVEKNPDDPNGDTCYLRFHAGPPYEDVAFKIVNREWALAAKRGFKCVFDRDVLQLWFNFKRYRYRR